MQEQKGRARGLVAALAVATTLALAGSAHAQGTPGQVPVGGRVQADGACYVRLPDLPRGLYGGFAAYNPNSGVLAYVGGAEKRTEDNTIAYYQMYAIRLDGTQSSWRQIPYSGDSGYLRETDRGCREMAGVMLPSGNWVSVGGKDGCDGTVDRWGDLKELQVGAQADPSSVRWVANSGADRAGLPVELADDRFRLARLFATYDAGRDRIVFGQGTFDDEKEQATQDAVYQATRRGSRWNVTRLRPTGEVPSARYGTCAAYVRDDAAKVDGILVLGGQQGGSVGTKTYNEVWWLDFVAGPHGEWRNITGRFANMSDIGYRREGACAYDAGSKTFYSWMGRASSSVPDGARHSAGTWRVDLSQLGDQGAQLTWQRLGKDNITDPKGRRLVPSVYDWANRRLFAIGGRYDLDEFADVWAIYPDATGDACANLDPYAPFRPSGTTATPGTPTTPPATATTVTPVATAATPAPAPPQVCAYLTGRVPGQVVSDAVANPASVVGHGTPCNPNVPGGPLNPLRSRLGLQNPNRPYHPLYNGVVWKCGCP